MNDTPVPRPTRGYLVAAWTTALLFGVLAGSGIWFMSQDVRAGVISGVVIMLLAGLASVLAARREGRGSTERAPPWTGDAAARHHNGGSV
ncbi:hypothetical protein [Microbacterium xylanilyticum]